MSRPTLLLEWEEGKQFALINPGEIAQARSHVPAAHASHVHARTHVCQRVHVRTRAARALNVGCRQGYRLLVSGLLGRTSLMCATLAPALSRASTISGVDA